MEEKLKYAKWKAADIAKAFREGRTPQPGPAGGLGEDGLGDELGNNLALPGVSGLADPSFDMPTTKEDDAYIASELAKLTAPSTPEPVQRGHEGEGESQGAGVPTAVSPTTSTDEDPERPNMVRSSSARARARLSMNVTSPQSPNFSMPLPPQLPKPASPGRSLSSDVPAPSQGVADEAALAWESHKAAGEDDHNGQAMGDAVAFTPKQADVAANDGSATGGFQPGFNSAVFPPGMAGPDGSSQQATFPDHSRQPTEGSAFLNFPHGAHAPPSPASRPLPTPPPREGLPLPPGRSLSLMPSPSSHDAFPPRSQPPQQPSSTLPPSYPSPSATPSALAPPLQPGSPSPFPYHQQQRPYAPLAPGAPSAHVAPSAPAPPSAPPAPSAPSAPSAPPASALPESLDPKMTARAQKAARFAASALDYDDLETARRQLREALDIVEGRTA